VKKRIAFLLCICLLFSLASCFSLEPKEEGSEESATESGTGESTGTESTEHTTDSQSSDQNVQIPEDSGSVNRSPYYRVDQLAENRYRYCIYDLTGKTIFSQETDSPVTLSMHDTYVVTVRQQKGDLEDRIFCDVQNNRISKVFSNVVSVNEFLIAYRDFSREQPILIVQDFFDERAFYKEYLLNYTGDPESVHLAQIPDGTVFATSKDIFRDLEWATSPLPLPTYGCFSDYAAVVVLYREMVKGVGTLDNSTNIPTHFGITDPQQITWFEKLLQSIRTFVREGTTGTSYQYTVRDLNNDGIMELILLNGSHEVLAIFTKVDGKPYLVDHFRVGRTCAIDHKGRIYINGGASGGNRLHQIYQIAADGRSLELIAAFGYEALRLDTGERDYQYYYFVNGEKILISKDEYDEFAEPYSSPDRFTTENCAEFTLYGVNNTIYACQADARQTFLGVVGNRVPILDMKTGNFCYLKEYKAPTSGLALAEIENLGYTLTDMDRDGITELVIHCHDTLLLRYYEGVVYLYAIPHQVVSHFNTDGSYAWIRADKTLTYGVSRIAFDGLKLTSRELERIENKGGMEVQYYRENRAFPLGDALHHFEHHPKTAIPYAPLALPMERTLSGAEAWQLANAYWRDAEGDSTGAAGTRLTTRVILREDPYDDFGYYRVIMVTERRHHWAGYDDGGDVYGVDYERAVLVNAQTGECIPYVESDIFGK